MILKRVWFLRDNIVDLRGGSKFGSSCGVGANVEGVRGGGVVQQPHENNIV